MRFVRAFADGWGQMRRCWPVVLPLYLANLALAGAMTLPAFLLMRDTIGNRPWATELPGSIDANLLSDLVGAAAAGQLIGSGDGIVDPGGVYGWPSLVVLVLSWLAYAFLIGGVLEAIHGDEARGGGMGSCVIWRSYLEDCRRWFGPFVRLALITLALLGAAVVGAGILAGLLLAMAPVCLLGLPLVLLLFVGLQSVLEYARVGAVVRQERRMTRALADAFSFFLCNVGPASGLVLLLWVVLAALLVIHITGARVIPGSWLVLTILWQQIYALAAVFAKILRLASQMSLYENTALLPATRGLQR